MTNLLNIPIDNSGVAKSIAFEDNISIYRISGTETLTNNFVISIGGGYPENSKTTILYVGKATYNGGYVQILSRVLTQQEAKSILFIELLSTGTDIEVTVIQASDTAQDRFKGFESHALDITGETITLDPKGNDDTLELTGSGSLTGSITVTGAAAKEGDKFFVKYSGTITAGAFGIGIFGVSLTADQILNGNVIVLGVYDGSNWTGYLLSGQYLNKVSQSEIETGTDNDKFVTALRLAQKLTHWLANVTATFVNKVTFTNGINLANVSASERLETDASKNVISVAKATADNKPFGTSAGEVMEGDDSRALTYDLFGSGSFETDCQGDIDFNILQPMTISTVQITVSKTLSGTDNGTVTILNNGVALATQVIPDSTVIGTTYALVPVSNNVFTNGDVLTVRTSKGTVGGSVNILYNILKG